MAPEAAEAGFVGPLPGRPGLVDGGLPEAVLTRWDRWWEIAGAAAAGRPAALSPYRPAWRLMTRAGIFGPAPLAGCFRLAPGGPRGAYPFAVLRPGPPPDPADPWYDRAEALVRAATDGEVGLAEVERARSRLPSPAPAGAGAGPDGAALAWRDDWEVREVRFGTAAELAAFPLALAAEAPPAEGTAWV